jgi:hypothetical protein
VLPERVDGLRSARIDCAEAHRTIALIGANGSGETHVYLLRENQVVE